MEYSLLLLWYFDVIALCFTLVFLLLIPIWNILLYQFFNRFKVNRYIQVLAYAVTILWLLLALQGIVWCYVITKEIFL